MLCEAPEIAADSAILDLLADVVADFAVATMTVAAPS
jgi:hypothetical protein